MKGPSRISSEVLGANNAHPTFLSEQLIKKQTHYAQRLGLILVRNLEHQEYNKSFIDTLTELDGVASNFGLSRQDLLKRMGIELSEKDLFIRYRTFLEWHESLSPDDPTYTENYQKYGLLVDSASISETIFEVFLEANIATKKSQRPNIQQRTMDLLEAKKGEELIAEIFRAYDRFLYSETFSGDFYKQLITLAAATDMSLETVVEQRSSRLSDSEKYILNKIQSRSKVTYADYMQMALYDPEYGFYTRQREDNVVGSQKTGTGEFETMPERFTDFGRGVALDLFTKWQALGYPKDFQIIEMGAGQGTLARDILQTIEHQKSNSTEWQHFRDAVRYSIVEISSTLIKKQRERLGNLADQVDWVHGSAIDVKDLFEQKSVTGVFLSNELPDAFPVHKVCMVGEELREVYVTTENGVLIETEGELSTVQLQNFLKANDIHLAEGESRVINLCALEWIDSMNSALRDGYIMTFDYGLMHSTQQAILDLAPHFRKYGRELTREQFSYFGTEGEGTPFEESVVMIEAMSSELGKEKMLEHLADIMNREQAEAPIDVVTEFIQAKPIQEMQTVMTDYSSHPLPQAGNVDITTDADFPSMERYARTLGLEKVFLGTQRAYFERYPFSDKDTLKDLEPTFLDSTSKFKVQIFRKEPSIKKEKVALAIPYSDLLERATIETVRDIEVFLDFLTKNNPVGLSRVAQAIRDYAAVTHKSLAGISSESIICFATHDKDQGQFILDRENRFSGGISIQRGLPISEFVMACIDLVPYKDLPDEYKDYLQQSHAQIREDMPFLDLNKAVFSRLVKDRAVKTHIGAVFFTTIYEMGYLDRPDLDITIENVRNLADTSIDILENRTEKLEPFRTQAQLNALHISLAIAQGSESIPKAISSPELFNFNQGAVLKNVVNILSQSLNEDPGTILMELATAIPAQLYSQIMAVFSGGQINPQSFFAIKDTLIAEVIALTAKRTDKDKNLEPQIIETDLGTRIISAPSVDRDGRIKTESENSKNLVALFSTYASYVDHLLRVKPGDARQEHLINLIRIMDPARDVKLLEILMNNHKPNVYSSEKGDFELAKTLYEKGFRAKACEIFKSWDIESYQWSKEAVAFLSENKETEILAPYLTAHRGKLSVDTTYFGQEFQPLSIAMSSYPDSGQLFEEEWAHIKNSLRVFIAASEKESNIDRFSSWWANNKERFVLDELPFDVFSSSRNQNYNPGSFRQLSLDGKWIILPIQFIEKALREPQFRSRAIDLIGEFDDSPMKVKLYELASENLPEEWDIDKTKAFFTQWQKTLHAVGKQVAAHDYEEPIGDFLTWRTNHREEIDVEVRRMLPKDYQGSRFFHEGVQKIAEVSLALAKKRKNFTDLHSVASDVVSSLGHRSGISYNPIVIYGNHSWITHPLFNSGNKYGSTWASVKLTDENVNIDEFRNVMSKTSPPQEDLYFNYKLFRRSGLNNAPRVYIQSVKQYVDDMKPLYALALKSGFQKEAENIYECVRSEIVAVQKKVGDGFNYRDEQKQVIRDLENLWALQEVVQKLIVSSDNSGIEAEFETFAKRIREDSRGFFTPASIGIAARELSIRPECWSFSTHLFNLAIDKLAPRRGEKDSFSDSLRESIKESGISDEYKDEIYLYALTKMWPEDGYPLIKLLDLYGEGGSFLKLITEIFASEDRFPRAKSFLIEQVSTAVHDLDPLRHGEELSREFYSGFFTELKAIAYIAGHFGDRTELADPNNYERLKKIYSSEDEALNALESLHPELVKQDQIRGRQTALPTIAEIEQGKFRSEDLNKQLIELLKPGNDEIVLKEAFEVLAAWLRRDMFEVINAKEGVEEQKKWDESKAVVITEVDLQKKASYQLAWGLVVPHMTSSEITTFVHQAANAVFECRSRKEATAKACMAYHMLKDDAVSLDLKKIAFEMLSESDYLPGYVTYIYSQRIKDASNERQIEFFNDIALWDHFTPPKSRPYVLWVHLFEAEGEKHEKLRQHIIRYHSDEAHWAPDLQSTEDWWILQHIFKTTYNISHSIGAEQSRVAWVYQRFLKDMSLTERVIYHLGSDFEIDKVNTTYLMENWDRLESLESSEALTCYQELYPKGEGSWDLKTLLEISSRKFYEKKNLFILFKSAIEAGIEPELSRQEDRAEIHCVFELLKVLHKGADPNEQFGLKDLLRERFPSLGEREVQSLYELATNPFQVIEDIRREKNRTVGESKDWLSQKGYSYWGEKIWHKTIITAAGDTLSAMEQEALKILMYTFSKTHYNIGFRQMEEMFPYVVPNKSYGFEKKADVNAANLLLPQFAKYSFGELDEIAKKMPSYERMSLAGQHQMGICNIELPESFGEYHEFAIFLIKAYLGILKLGALEQIKEELKDLPPDAALYELFVIRDMVKLGQLLASRPEVPDHYRKILTPLEDSVSPSDIEEVRNTIQGQLRWKTEDFTLIKPLNAGSMGEVWLAIHKNYSIELAVKVLTPSKEKKIRETVQELKELQEILEWYSDVARAAAIGYEVVGKIISLMEGELDYRKDNENWTLLFGFDERKPDLIHLEEDGTVPIFGTNFHAAMYFEAAEKVLVMSYVKGVNVNDPKEGMKDTGERNAFAEELWLYLQNRTLLSLNGIYPTDLHLGNIMYTRNTNRKVLVDTGQVGNMSEESRNRIMQFFIAAYSGDVDGVTNSLLEMGHTVRQEEIDHSGLSKKVEELLNSEADPVVKVRDLFVQAPIYGLFVDDVYVDLLKCLMTFQGAILRLSPDFSLLP